MKYAVLAEGISKRFKEKGQWFDALKDVTIRVKEGEIFALLGPNGAGKTTLLNILLSLLLPEKGQVRLLDRDPFTDRGVIERVSYVSGETRFHWALKCRDILQFYGRVYGLSKPDRAVRIQEVCDLFKIHRLLDRRFDSLSTGERMRLVFAKAILQKPAVLLLDEPTLGLDPDIAITVRKMIQDLNRQGTTVLLTSHYMPEVEQLAQRLAFIYQGEIIDQGTIQEVKQRHLTTYEVIFHIRQVKNVALLRQMGFTIKGTRLLKTLPTDQNISETLTLLRNAQVDLLDFEVKRPTLEDYFIRITRP